MAIRCAVSLSSEEKTHRMIMLEMAHSCQERGKVESEKNVRTARLKHSSKKNERSAQKVNLSALVTLVRKSVLLGVSEIPNQRLNDILVVPYKNTRLTATVYCTTVAHSNFSDELIPLCKRSATR